MNIVDYIIIAVLIIFFFKGFRAGIIGSLGWIIGLVAGVWAAGKYVEQAASWLDQWLHNPSWSAVLGFIGVLLIVMVIIGLFFWLANKIVNFVPFVGVVNRFFGGILGIIEGALLIGVALWFILILPLNNSFTQAINNSSLKTSFVNASGWVRALLPDWMQSAQTLDFARFGLSNPGQFSADDLLKRLSPEQLELIKNKLNQTK
ncbi:MAG: CvpA family protein [Candidatus Komeilibacteria bacterium]